MWITKCFVGQPGMWKNNTDTGEQIVTWLNEIGATQAQIIEQNGHWTVIALIPDVQNETKGLSDLVRDYPDIMKGKLPEKQTAVTKTDLAIRKAGGKRGNVP